MMKKVIAGALVLMALAACGRKDKPADQGFGAGAAPADTTPRDTTRIPATPVDSTSRPQ
jgi:hypothetical protein